MFSRQYYVSDLNWENGSPFRERGTCLAEVRLSTCGAELPRSNEKREPAKTAGRGGAFVAPAGPLHDV
jgi:hypothetical protein